MGHKSNDWFLVRRTEAEIVANVKRYTFSSHDSSGPHVKAEAEAEAVVMQLHTNGPKISGNH